MFNTKKEQKKSSLKLSNFFNLQLDNSVNSFEEVEKVNFKINMNLKEDIYVLSDTTNLNLLKKQIESKFISISTNYSQSLSHQIILKEDKFIFIDNEFHETFIVDLNDIISFEIYSSFEDETNDDLMCYHFKFNFVLKNFKKEFEFQFKLYPIFSIQDELYLFNINESKTKQNIYSEMNKHYFTYLDRKNIKL